MLTAEIKDIATSDEYMGTVAQTAAQEIIALTAQRSHEVDEYRVIGMTARLDDLHDALIDQFSRPSHENL